MKSKLCSLLVFLTLCPSLAYSWTARGHRLVTQVACRLLENAPNDSKILRPFLMKEDLLGHISNLPDHAWKISPEIRKILDPTHYFEIDRWTDAEMSQFLVDKKCKKNCSKDASYYDVLAQGGTAIWRSQQFFDLMLDALQRVHSQPLSKKDTLLVDKAIDAAGLLSHFVGDLTNPQHTSKEFDAWGAKQGGLHVFFEADVIDALPLSLTTEVFDYATKEKPFEKLIQSQLAPEYKKDTFAITMMLAKNSIQHLEELHTLDRKHSLLKESIGESRTKAERRPAKDVAEHFRTFAISRLALAADTLSHLWYFAWEKAHKPDLSTYFSLEYTLNMEPVLPTYLYPY